MNLVIVESPAKARTLGKYLGSNYIVDSCMGHIMGVSERRSGGYKWGINIKGDYDIDYVVDEAKQQTVDRLKSKAKKATKIYLATDPDREGEAISWHLSMLLDIEPTDDCRIIFNEISKKAVLYALENPAPINMNLVNSQQARAVMDKLVGYELSPVLWSKVASKLSAGRVQSVALKLIVEREREIQGFIPVEYWTLSAILNRVAGTKEETIKFSAYLHSKLNTSGKAEKIKPANKGEMDAVLADLKSAEYAVTNVKKSVTTSNPPPPFITSTLQQDASNKLGFAASRTMRAAQSLYEGVELEGTPQALITYMRTDSVRVSPDSQREALDYIKTRYGAEYAPPTPNFYKGKKNTQDAHEAIRPITVNINPQAIKGKVSADLYKLYKLIYERFLASQMTPAKYDSVSVDINASNYIFRATGRTLKFAGYTAVYSKEVEKKESDEPDGTDENNKNITLPPLEVGQRLNLNELLPEQKFTKPPARFTEASLVKELEAKGIGRPSTYASILNTLTKRDYTTKDGRALVPTDIGFKVSDVLQRYFNAYINVEFTSQMEDRLDDIAEGGRNWKDLVGNFYPRLKEKVDMAKTDEFKLKEPPKPTDIKCDKCADSVDKKTGEVRNTLMVIRKTKTGREFLACPRFPHCRNAKPLTEPEVSDTECSLCGNMMVVKEGKNGQFLACPGFPECKNTVDMGGGDPVAKCPMCQKNVFKRKSKRGRDYYACEDNKGCNFFAFDLPTGEFCPECKKPLVLKQLKKGDQIKCSDTKGCKYVK